jgi:hypothetical protein
MGYCTERWVEHKESFTQTKLMKEKDEGTRFPRVKLAEPLPSGFVHVAAEVDARPPFLPNSRTKRQLLACCKEWCRQLEDEPEVLDAVVFDALVATPVGASSSRSGRARSTSPASTSRS